LKPLPEKFDFIIRHDITTVTGHLKMSEVYEAFEHLEAGKARYRIGQEN
jgi:D-arabinose 1-dehydrogenase-like Zn-dependent alcohol dehydrogenase